MADWTTRKLFNGRVLVERHRTGCPCSICNSLKYVGVGGFGFLAPIDKSWNSWRWIFRIGRNGIRYIRWTGFWLSRKPDHRRSALFVADTEGLDCLPGLFAGLEGGRRSTMTARQCDWYEGNADGSTDCEYERGHDGPHSYQSPDLARMHDALFRLLRLFEPEVSSRIPSVEEVEAKARDLRAENEQLTTRVFELLEGLRQPEIEELQAKYDQLTGEKFSDRVHTALKSRAEVAEATLASVQALPEQWRQRSTMGLINYVCRECADDLDIALQAPSRGPA